jgi:glycosyltransferase involved in cell wall biosynthesis
MFSFLKKTKPVISGTHSMYSGKCVSILREFKKPPYGGGNQFMLALKKGMEDLGVIVVNNEISKKPDAYIFDSAWLDKNLLRKLRKLQNPLVAHRIDGPIQLYRGSDRTADDEIFELNREFATVSIIQSQFTLKNLLSLGYQPINPVIIYNAVNPSIFFSEPQVEKHVGKIRIVSASWSDNPNKGGATYKWLDDNLDFNKIEYIFVGRIKEKLNNIKLIPPVDSEKLAKILRKQDIYITASENDPCSNSLIEGLASGLPAIYRNSGGHSELVKDAGLPFERPDHIPSQIEKIYENYESYRDNIKINTITDIAKQYLDAIFKQNTNLLSQK